MIAGHRHRDRGDLDRGFHGRRRAPAVRLRARGRARPRGPRGDRRQRHGRAAHRPLGGIHRRPPGSRRDDPPAHGLRRGGRGLSVRAGTPEPGRDRAGRGGGGAEAGERAGRERLHDGGRAGRPGRAADQRGRRAGARGLGRIPRGGEGDRRAGNVHAAGAGRAVRRDQRVVPRAPTRTAGYIRTRRSASVALARMSRRSQAAVWSTFPG